ncbi:MAG: Gfo/Idh/MocA family protein [Armatimonadota bacterium]
MQKVAVIGCGFMGETHMAAYDALDTATLAYAVDANEEKVKEVAGKFGVEASTDFDAVLADESVTLVDICLPTYLHREFTEKALAAGKHVLCEKPMALTVEDARAMADAAANAGRFLMIAQVLRFWPEYVRAKQIIDSGELGSLIGMSCVRRSPRPQWSWQGWMLRPDVSGGAALDLHIHDTDWVCYTLGRPRAVSSVGIKSEMGWDHIYTNYLYDDGRAATAEGGNAYAPSFSFRAAFTALLERGHIDFDSAAQPPLSVYRLDSEQVQHPEVEPVVAGKAAAGGNIEELGGYFMEIKYFVECCESGTPPSTVTPEDGVQAVEVTLAEMRSAETGAAVEL